MWDVFVESIQHLGRPPYSYFAAATVVLLAIIYLIHRYRRANRPIVPFRAEGGDVEIAPQTIRGIINGATLRVMGVETSNCRYAQKGRKLRVQVTIHLRASAKLTEVSAEIKKKVRYALKSHIGMEPTDIDPIKIKVTKIIGEASVVDEEPEPTESGVELERYDEIEPEVPEGQGPYRS
jgi:uncharacterized alkaline shock family protein YloU